MGARLGSRCTFVLLPWVGLRSSHQKIHSIGTRCRTIHNALISQGEHQFQGFNNSLSIDRLRTSFRLTAQQLNMSDLEAGFDETQVGGGGRTTTPPAVTPTRLRTSIKATDRDCGLISKAQICRTRQTVRSTDPEVGCASDLFQSADNGILVDFLQTPLLFADSMHITRFSRISNAEGKGLRATLGRWRGFYYSNRWSSQ